MGWERRGRHEYYDKKERTGSRIRSVYVGRGKTARIIYQIQSGFRTFEKLAQTLQSPEAVKQTVLLQIANVGTA